jgi:Type II secretory pathway, component PulF
MAGNFIISYYMPDGSRGIKNVAGPDKNEISRRLQEEGYVPHFIARNIILDILTPVTNAGINEKALSLLFLELHWLVHATGSVIKAFSFIEHGIIIKSPFQGENVEGIHRNKIFSLLSGIYENHLKSRSKKKRGFIRRANSLLNGGHTLRDILFENYFDDIVVSLADLAYSTGDYSAVFLKMSEYYGAKKNLKKNIISSLSYPLFLFLLLFLAFVVFLYYVIPSFSSFFSQFSNINPSTVSVLKFFLFVKGRFIYCFPAFLIILSVFFIALKNKITGFY